MAQLKVDLHLHLGTPTHQTHGERRDMAPGAWHWPTPAIVPLDGARTSIYVLLLVQGGFTTVMKYELAYIGVSIAMIRLWL